MPTSSPYSGNDYSSFSYRPYQLPVNSILQAFSAKNQFWEQGAQRIKSRYDSILDLDLSKEENRRIRDEFLSKSQDELQKMSSQDLSDPSIQRKGLSLFQPLLQDKGILYDDQATKHYKKVLSEAEQLRKKDNGKYYSDANLQYALDGWQDFLSNPDRMAGQQYLQKAKELTPYYDYSGEVNTLLKNCKPDEASSDTITGMYIQHSSSSSLSAQKISSCLDAGLSDKAWKQMSINGFVAYKNNPQALRDSYLPLISGEASNLSSQNAAYSAILQNKDKLSKLSPAELKKMGISDPSTVTPEFLSQLEQKKMNNELRLDNLNKTIGSLQAGDLSPITGDNFETIAGKLYAKDYMENFGRGFSYDKVDQSTKSDPVQLMIYGQNRQDARQEDSQNFQLGLENKRENFQVGLEAMREQHDMNKETLKQQADLEKAKLKNGDFSVLSSNGISDARHFNPAFQDNVAESDNYDKLGQKIKEVDAQKVDVNQKFLAKMKQLGMPSEIKAASSPEAKAWYSAFTKTLPKDDPSWKIITEYEDTFNKLNMQRDILSNNKADIDQAVSKVATNPHQELFNQIVADKTPVYGSKTKADILSDIQSGRATLRIDKAPLGRISYDYIGSDGRHKTFDMSKVDMDPKLKKEFFKIEDYLSKAGEYNKQLKETRNKLASEKTIIQTEGFAFPQLNEKDSPFKQRIAQRLGVGEKDIDRITIGDTDMKGSFVISINQDDSDKSFSPAQVEERLKKEFGVNNIRPVPNQPGSYIVPGFQKFDIIDNSRVSNMFEPYIRGLESRTTTHQPQTTKLIRSADPHSQYGLEVSAGLKPGQYDYRIYDNKNNTVDIFNDRKTALNKFDVLLNARPQ